MEWRTSNWGCRRPPSDRSTPHSCVPRAYEILVMIRNRAVENAVVRIAWAKVLLDNLRCNPCVRSRKNLEIYFSLVKVKRIVQSLMLDVRQDMNQHRAVSTPQFFRFHPAVPNRSRRINFLRRLVIGDRDTNLL